MGEYLQVAIQLGGTGILVATLQYFTKQRLEGIKKDIQTEVEQLRGDLALQSKTHESELRQREYVTQAQYDLEVVAYQAVWTRVVALDRAMDAVRRDFARTRPAFPTAAAQQYTEKVRELEEAVNVHRPFIPDGVFTSICAILAGSTGDVLEHFAKAGKDGSVPDKSLMAAHRERARQAADAIRERIGTIRVVNG